MEIGALLAFLVLLLLNLYALRKIPWFLPIKLFVIFNAVMCGGILIQLDFFLVADQAHALMIILSSLGYLMGSFYFSRKFGLNTRSQELRPVFEDFKAPSDFQLSLGFYCFSGVMVLIYFALLGRNVLLTAISSSLSASDVVDLRLASYAGDSYFAPGYFNQFKNILFPAAFLSLAYFASKSSLGLLRRIVVIVLMLVPVIIGLAGTGQRGYIFSFLVATLIFIGISGFIRPKRFGISFRAGFIIFILFFSVFSTSSYFLGRSEDASIFGFAEALFVRIFNDNQYSAVVGFRYIYTQDVQFGGEWLIDILGILPGEDFRGSDLPNRIHAIIYGSDRGTAPLSMWGSVFHNWGWPGAFLFSLILAWIYAAVSRHFLRSKNLSALSVAAFAYLFFILGEWVASGPMQLINNGLVTALLLLFLARRWKFKIGI